jgi:hypothetical protein
VKVFIKENSLLARLAAIRLKQDKMAMVMGRTILLYNTSGVEFMQHQSWVRHELVHVKQFKEHGYIGFLCKYLWESIKKGYYNNKYEVEARAGETDASLDGCFELHHSG